LEDKDLSNESQAREIIDSFPIKKSTVDDIEIEYKILKPKNINGSDENTPLLFIAGLRITMDMWPPKMLNELAQSNSSVIIYNNRGTGNSSTGTKDYSIKRLAKDAAGLLNSLDIEKANVIGWSMGAYIATEMALSYPDKVNSLVLYGSGPGGDKAIPSSAELMQTLGGVSGTPEEQARQILSFFFPSPWLLDNPNFRNQFPLLKSTVSIETTQKQAQAIVGWDGIYSSPSLITQPTLVLIGTEDIITTPKAAFSLVEKIPLISIIQIKDAGHGLMYQYPEKFTKVLQTFLNFI